jgi:hypothetical protein
MATDLNIISCSSSPPFSNSITSETNVVDSDLLVMSDNMHGYNQGYTTQRDFIDNKDVDVIMLQEHWLTPANLNRFSIDFVDYY